MLPCLALFLHVCFEIHKPAPGRICTDVGADLVSTCRLADKGQYQDFLKCLNLYAQDICSRHELSAAVQDVLGRYPELLVRQVDSLILQTAFKKLPQTSEVSMC